MNRTVINALIALSCTVTMLFLGGCADDLRNRNLFDSGAGEAVISFSIENVAMTRSDEAQQMETVVDYAYLLFYNTSASLLTDAPIAAVKAEINTDQPGKLQFKMPLTLESGKDYQMIAVANADSYVPDRYSDFKSYLEAWCRQPAGSLENPLHLYSASWISPKNRASLPMNAGLTGDSKFRFTIDNGKYNVNTSLSFRRMVARIDVANLVNDGFKIEGVALCNWRNGVAISALDSEIGNRLGNICGVLSGTGEETENLQFIDMPIPDENGNQQLIESLYCFPSVSSAASTGDSESTALIIKAKYGSDSQSSYYRVNVGMTGNHSQVKANTKYAVVIQSVKGPGASTPQEAYSSSAESPIVLSVVEDWNLEDGHFAMDDYGNFIVVSKGGPFTFESNSSENVVIRVLTSKGLNWDAEFAADNEVSTDGFNVSKVGDTAISIAPKGVNEDEEDVTGVCRIFANTQQGGTLEVNIPLTQKGSEEKPYEPVEPTNLPFGLIPTSGERVKIDHENKTIEIDGFDPDCFNSFIDIEFQVYVNDTYNLKGELTLSSDLVWPVEGGIAKTFSEGYYYCSNSFKTTSSGYKIYSSKIKDELNSSAAIGAASSLSNTFSIIKDEKIHVIVGAMAPDDPVINRYLSLNNYNSDKEIKYKLVIKPRATIIDDVILTDSNGKSWLIFDRNLQDISSFSDFVGRMTDGEKRQAYNYFSQPTNIKIPSKYSSTNDPFNEIKHLLYLGEKVLFSKISDIQNNDGHHSELVRAWLGKYQYSNDQERTSPFYEVMNGWQYPTQDLIKLCASKMHVSKMRMYLVSEIPAKAGKKNIPICCYWPYNGSDIDKWLIDPDYSYGYYYADGYGNPHSMIFVYHDRTEMKTEELPTSGLNYFNGLSRLVRPLSTTEVENYKNSYLGYGSAGLKLQFCHPDTYTSSGWISY